MTRPVSLHSNNSTPEFSTLHSLACGGCGSDGVLHRRCLSMIAHWCAWLWPCPCGHGPKKFARPSCLDVPPCRETPGDRLPGAPGTAPSEAPYHGQRSAIRAHKAVAAYQRAFPARQHEHATAEVRRRTRPLPHRPWCRRSWACHKRRERSTCIVTIKTSHERATADVDDEHGHFLSNQDHSVTANCPSRSIPAMMPSILGLQPQEKRIQRNVTSKTNQPRNCPSRPYRPWCRASWAWRKRREYSAKRIVSSKEQRCTATVVDDEEADNQAAKLSFWSKPAMM